MNARAASHAPVAVATPEALTALVYAEARCLDERRWDDWLALFAEDCLYWLPLSPAIDDPRRGQALAAEDRLLLSVRVGRLKEGKAPSLQPMPACQHVLQAPSIEVADAEANRYVTRTPFLYAEIRAGQTTLLAGVATHRMRVESGGLRIVEKRVDLADAAGPVPSIFLMP
jgi:3-phenylpropionate/cinnamic acid dioxygenase small subunit